MVNQNSQVQSKIIKAFFGNSCAQVDWMSKESHDYLQKVRQMVKEYLVNLKENEGYWDDELESIWDNL